MNSRHFLVATPSEETSSYLRLLFGGSPMPMIDSPIAFLSEPLDKDDFSSGLVDDLVTLEACRSEVVSNPRTGRAEFVVLVNPEIPTLLSDIGVDNIHFQPYMTLCFDPYTSSRTRKWCRSVANSLAGKKFNFLVSVSDDPRLLNLFNTEMENMTGERASSSL